MSAVGRAASRIDAHCHVWQLSRGDYGWLEGEGGPLAPIRRDFLPADLDPLARGAGISGRILVQAAPTLAETRWLLACAAADPETRGVVGWVDLEAEDAGDVMRDLSADPLFLGIRPMLQDLDEPDWIATRPRPQALEALVALGLRFDALVTPRHLPALLVFFDRLPGLPVVIDHAAKPLLAAPQDDPRNVAWARDMARAAARPDVCVKLSGLLTEMQQEHRRKPSDAAHNLAPVVDRLFDWFGAGRILWGSDWPVLTLAAGFTFWDEVTQILLAGLAQKDREAVLGGNAARFYGVKEEGA